MNTLRPTLERLIGIDAELFLGSYFGREPIHARPDSARPPLAVSWPDVNRVLNRGIPFPQVRLLQRGGDLLSDRYTYAAGGNRYADPAACEALMAEGATLLIRSANHINDEIDALLAALGRELRGDARVDIVATLVPVSGFGTHWDHTECFNAQIAGVKRWNLYRPVRPCPLGETLSYPKRTDAIELPPPTGDPTYTFTTHPGDVLYVPRGWWHSVMADELPSLHLSISVDLPTVSDALRWHAERLQMRDLVRQTIPHWLDDDGWATFVRALDVAIAAPAEQILAEFLDQDTRAVSAAPTFSLPGSDDESMPEGRHLLVRLRDGGRLLTFCDAGEVVFQVKRRTYRFSAELKRALDALNGRWIAFTQLAEQATPSALYDCLAMLWADAVVSVADARQLSPADAP